MRYEYKVLPAPRRGRKSVEVKSAEGQFALGVEDQLNDLAREGWEYIRSDILPSDERHGLTSTRTVYRSMLIFRRAIRAAVPGPVLSADPGSAKAGITPDIDPERSGTP